MEGLKPCPFCGGNKLNTRLLMHRDFEIVCMSCGAKGPEGDSIPHTKELWNTRKEAL